MTGLLVHPFESGEAGHEPAEGGETLAPSERRFTPPAASKPISGVGLVGSVVLGRVAPVLLRVVRGLQRLLGRLERALAGPRR